MSVFGQLIGETLTLVWKLKGKRTEDFALVIYVHEIILTTIINAIHIMNNKKENLQILFAQFLSNVARAESKRRRKRSQRKKKWNNVSAKLAWDAIISLKEFITTLICLYLHSYFIMLRDCGRNETIYIYKKCFECLLHQLSASLFVFKLKMFCDESRFRVDAFIFRLLSVMTKNLCPYFPL